MSFLYFLNKIRNREVSLMVVINPGETCKYSLQCKNSDNCERAKKATSTKLVCYQFKGFDGKKPSEFNTSSKLKILHG